MEVKVQSGSHGVMLSGRWEDKHVLKGGDERETDEGEPGSVGKTTELWKETSASERSVVSSSNWWSLC